MPPSISYCLNNILEQDHRAIKRRVNAKPGFGESRLRDERFRSETCNTTVQSTHGGEGQRRPGIFNPKRLLGDTACTPPATASRESLVA
jgi:hypothetical protein